MATINIATFPQTIDSCAQTWAEKQSPNTIRTSMENQTVKVRRRTTGIQRVAEITITLKSDVYQDFVDFYNVDCQQGIVPARFTTPYGKSEVWRISNQPQIDWIDKKAFTVSMQIEQLPIWIGL
jgi:hypothetical protein